MGLATDFLSGNVYIAAAGNSLIRMVDPRTGIITTVAGGGSGGDGGLATDAWISGPCDVKTDGPAGNIYFSETCVIATGGGGGGTGTGPLSRVRRVDANTGIITTIAGTSSQAGFAGDCGPATQALLNTPVGLAFDSNGNLFIADSGNNRIRRVDPRGTITTVAGNGSAAFSGDGGPATSASLNSPYGVAVDANGNLYIADLQNNRIRRVDATTGVITTIAGTGLATFDGDGVPATSASLNFPASLAFNSAGNLIFTDALNNRLRMIDSAGLIWTIAGTGCL
jgi:sugar lactone lactonase YvrE